MADKNYEEIGQDYVIVMYDYGHKLGHGAFADVYRCHKLINGQLSKETYVAKKIMMQKHIPNMKELIDREIQLMFTLIGENPFVVKIMDYFPGKSSGESFLIMECCEGGDLDKYVEENGPFPEEEIVDILLPVAKCFAQLHRQGIIHRDLKLANLLLAKKMVKGEKPDLRITDFGLAYEVGAENVAYTTCGTPLYMAPEIWNRDRKGYTSKIDVWSFGNIIYKLMYGEYPFEDVQVEKKVKEGLLRFPKIRTISLECMDLMLKCLRRDPKTRISFDDIVAHPFFAKRELKFFDRIFDGYFGYFDVNIDNKYDLLADPNCIGIPAEEPDIFDLHNEEVIKRALEKGAASGAK